jgi:hypothetical protein
MNIADFKKENFLLYFKHILLLKTKGIRQVKQLNILMLKQDNFFRYLFIFLCTDDHISHIYLHQYMKRKIKQ